MEALLHSAGGAGKKEGRGAVGWIVDRLLAMRGCNVADKREMHLVETLSLGGRRQLMLVECGARRYLVGVGAESVETIVAVTEQSSASVQPKDGAAF